MTTTFAKPIEIGAGSLTGKVALVTGSSRGIGAAIATELARCGAHVVINYVSRSDKATELQEEIIKDGGSASTKAADVSNWDDVHAMITGIKEEFGAIDILVNNAGILRDRTFKKMTMKDWHEVIDTNLTSVMNCCHSAMPLMIEKGSGRIVNISSFVGQQGNFGQSNYAAAKAGILGFTKSLALEYAKTGITVNAVCPGFVNTEMWQSVPDNIKEKIIERIPQRRVAEPVEIARVVRFLVTEADYMTGQSLSINGGLYMGW